MAALAVIFCVVLVTAETWAGSNSSYGTYNGCGLPPDVANASVVVNETTTPFMTGVYTCDVEHGYVLRGNDSIFCVTVFDYSLWSAVSFTCERIQCQGHPLVENTTTSTDYMHTVTVSRRCTYYERDYRRNGCYYNRQVIYNTTYMAKEVYYGGHVNVTCRNGYQYSDNATKTRIGCNVNGQWIYPNKTCQPKDCGPMESFEGVDCDDTPTIYPTRVMCKCKEGYERVVQRTSNYQRIGGNRIYRNITDNNYIISCSTSGRWSPPDDSRSPTCTRVYCPRPPQITYTQRDKTVETGWRYKDTVTYFCIPGYESKANTTISCLANQTWSRLPKCIRKDCGQPRALPNGHVTMYVTNTTFEATIPYACNVGFRMVGTNYTRCGEEGTWSTLPICHRIRCNEPPIISHGRRTVGGHYLNDTTMYLCDVGFTLYGNSTIRCQFDGHWTVAPECHAISCGAPPTVNHATIVIKSGYQFGDTVDYHCSNGYSLSGVSFVTCLSTSQWSTAPTCFLPQPLPTLPPHQYTVQRTQQPSTAATTVLHTTTASTTTPPLTTSMTTPPPTTSTTTPPPSTTVTTVLHTTTTTSTTTPPPTTSATTPPPTTSTTTPPPSTAVTTVLHTTTTTSTTTPPPTTSATTPPSTTEQPKPSPVTVRYSIPDRLVPFSFSPSSTTTKTTEMKVTTALKESVKGTEHSSSDTLVQDIPKSHSNSHKGLTAAVAALTAVFALVLVAATFRYILKFRRRRGHDVGASVHNALYSSAGETMTLYSFKSSPDTEQEEPSEAN